MAISNLSTGLRPGVCTSTTRPSAPFEGQMIYETDTDKVLVWNGSAWYANWNLPWGFIGSSTGTASTAITGGTALSVLTLTVTMVAGRRYEVYGKVGFQPSANTVGNMMYVSCSGFTSEHLWYRGDQILANYPQVVSGTIIASASDFGVTSGTSSKTLTLHLRTSGNGALNTNPDAIVGANSAPQIFAVRDIGPV